MNLVLKKVTYEESFLLFKWVNDDEVRKNSFNTDIIKIQEHLKWFNNKVNSDNCLIFVCYYDCIPIGQIRIDININMGIIDYSVDKKYRGNNFGTKILELIENEVLSINPKIDFLIGEVKYCNIGSQRAFEKNNYKKVDKEGFIYYFKKL